MKGLTKRQRELIDYIQEFITNNRYSPSYREIGERFGFSSTGSVYNHVQALKKKGVLNLEPKSSRSILPLESDTPKESSQEIAIPFIGYITAGMPVKLFPKPKEFFVPQSLLVVPERTYALCMQGDFLTEEMITDGDILLVEVRQHASPGETVIALINNTDTIVKKYYPDGDRVRFLSTYTQHNPIILQQDDILIQGIVIGLIRRY